MGARPMSLLGQSRRLGCLGMSASPPTPDVSLLRVKYSDTAMKAMTENPQDRGAAAAKLAEAFGGKMEAAYWFSSAGDYDGMVVWLLPNDQAAEALNIMTRASGNFSNTRTLTATRSIDRTSVSRRRQKPCLANSAPRSVL